MIATRLVPVQLLNAMKPAILEIWMRACRVELRLEICMSKERLLTLKPTRPSCPAEFRPDLLLYTTTTPHVIDCVADTWVASIKTVAFEGWPGLGRAINGGVGTRLELGHTSSGSSETPCLRPIPWTQSRHG